MPNKQGYDSVLSELQVTCWCEETIVWVKKSEILKGKTKSCGNLYCKELN